MKRAKVIGPSPRDLVADRRRRGPRPRRPPRGPAAPRGGSRGRRTAGSCGVHGVDATPAPVAMRRSARRSPGPTSECAPRSTGTDAPAAAAVSSAQPRVADAVRQEQVAREAVLGGRPAALVGAAVGGRAGRGGRAARRPTAPRRAGRATPGRRGPAACPRTLAAGAGSAGRPHGPDRRRAQPALLDEGPGARPGVALRPAQVRGGRPPRDQELRARVARQRRAARPSRSRTGLRLRVVGERQGRRPARALEQQQVQRRVDVHRQPAPRPEVADRDAGHLREPARQRVVRREVRRQVAERLAARGDRERRPRCSGGSRGRRAGRRPPPRRAPAGPPASRAGSSRRPVTTSRRRAQARRRAAGGACRMGYRRAARGGPRPRPRRPRGTRAGGAPRGPTRAASSGAQERSGVGRELRGEDEDGDGRHRPSLAMERRRAVARVRAYIGLGANVGDAAATLAAAVHALRGAAGCEAPRRLAALRHGAGRRARPAGVPQRGRGARRARRAGPGDRARPRCWSRSRGSSGRSGGSRASAGGRARSTWTCWCSGATGSSVERPPEGRSGDPAKAAAAAGRAARRGAAPAVRAGAAVRPGAAARAARLGRDRGDGGGAPARPRGCGRRPPDRALGRRRLGAAS